MSLYTSTARERKLAIRVGLFVALALMLGGVIVFLVGRETRIFQRHVTFRAYFENVEGLSAESPVWLGGLDVGRVEGVSFPERPGEPRLEVRLRVSAEHAPRVRRDSVARLSSMGVLGDKAVDISIGSLEEPPVPPGGEVPSVPGADLSSLMRSAAQVMEDSVAVSHALRQAVEAYTDPGMTEDVRASVRSLRALLEAVETGDGVLHALIYDKEAGQRVRVLLANASRAALRVDTSLEHVEALLREVRTGKGTAHALIYERDGARALRELGAAAGQLAGLLEEARRNPDGVVHQLVYGDSGNILADLGSAARSLREVMSTVERGEGSLGALIQDPTVYENLSAVLGNVKRNRVLRSLVRFAITNREDLDKVGEPLEAPDEAPQGVGGGGESGRRPKR
jgi:phospholipid/cholesterol/gamma-HCH transport system substrate-binding protein